MRRSTMPTFEASADMKKLMTWIGLALLWWVTIYFIGSFLVHLVYGPWTVQNGLVDGLGISVCVALHHELWRESQR